MSEFPAALTHTALDEILPDVFFVRGSFDMAPLVRITRNMVVLRHQGELTVVNSVRLTQAGEETLDALGEVKHLVRLGHSHGADDPWYVQRYAPTTWAPPGIDGPVPYDRVLGQEAPPVPGLRALVLEAARKPEAVLYLEREGGVLLSCDSLQNWTDTRGCSLMAKAVTVLMGFKHPVSPGPPWLQITQHRDGPSLEADYRRVAELGARHLLPGHGAPVHEGLAEALDRTIERLWAGR